MSREIRVYCLHTMRVTLKPIHPRVDIYMEITFMKYDQYCSPIIWSYCVEYTFFTLSSVMLSEKVYDTKTLYQGVW